MAERARRARVPSSQREARRGVVKLAVGPQDRVVAALACRGKIQRDMVYRRLRRVVSRLVTRNARRSGQIVVVVDMAQRTLQRGVSSGQREARRGVIERRVRPRGCVVATFAGGRILEPDMVDRGLGRVVVRLMAGDAGCVGQMIVVIAMALGAFCVRFVEPGQRPARRRVIEARPSPRALVMAPLAGSGLTDLRVIRHGCGVVLRDMAIDASFGC